MLLGLHVKNFAIIDEVEVDFRDNLNILTGETGAGKSILIGSINVALGGKVSKQMIRTGAEYALVELIFEAADPEILKKLEEYDIVSEDLQVVITRKIMANGRSICRINGEVTTTTILKEVTRKLLDIHGQHEHQSLLYKQKHLEILDRYAREEIGERKEEISKQYQEYISIKKELEDASMDEEKRLRELSFLEYELNEIEQAKLIEGEDEELQEEFRRLSNSRSITENLSEVYQSIAGDGDCVSDIIGRDVRLMNKASEYDKTLLEYANELSELEQLIQDFSRQIADYLDDFENSEEEFLRVQERLDQINQLKSRYGGSIDEIKNYAKEAAKRLERLQNHEEYMEQLKQKLYSTEKELEQKCKNLSDIRKEKAQKLTEQIKKALIDLNFLDVAFEMTFVRTKNFTANGYDEAEFILSTNPGEPKQPLSCVASGGELSRIMLAIKSVLAEKDEIKTLIFDEIDVGVSGRTAQKVSEKLAVIAACHQVLCITHLPQIAAMADQHFLIEKTIDQNITKTRIFPLEEEASVHELARILGGVEITESVLPNAREMKELARKVKKKLRK